jgi:hypothetical protein
MTRVLTGTGKDDASPRWCGILAHNGARRLIPALADEAGMA